MRMMLELLIPRMENTEEADFGSGGVWKSDSVLHRKFMPPKIPNMSRWRSFNASISGGYLCALTAANLTRWRTLRPAPHDYASSSYPFHSGAAHRSPLRRCIKVQRHTVQTCPPTALSIQNP